MKYLLTYKLVKRGFLTNEEFTQTEIVESKNLITAYEEQTKKASEFNAKHNGDFISSVIDIKEIK